MRQQPVLFMLIIPAAALALALGGCDSPRTKPMPVAQAQADRTPRKFKVIKVWDQTEQRVASRADALVSHYIEVEEIRRYGGEPPRLTLPFDEYATGRAPPEVGDEVVVAPADWVGKNPRALMKWQEHKDTTAKDWGPGTSVRGPKNDE